MVIKSEVEIPIDEYVYEHNSPYDPVKVAKDKIFSDFNEFLQGFVQITHRDIKGATCMRDVRRYKGELIVFDREHLNHIIKMLEILMWSANDLQKQMIREVINELTNK